MDKRKVIIDTDPGIDDAAALMTALSDDSLEILGFTTVAGNKGLDMTTTNAVRVSTYFDGRVKIYPGADNDYTSLKRTNHQERMRLGISMDRTEWVALISPMMKV